MHSVVVTLIFMCLRYAAVEATYGLYPEFSGSFSSHLGKSHNEWNPLGSNYNKFSNSYSSIYDTLNSDYSHALYPFGLHLFRIPVKGGLTVVPAPKNLELFKGISSYGGYSGLRHIPHIKKTPLNYYGGLSSSGHKHLKNVDFPSTHGLIDGHHFKKNIYPTYSTKHLTEHSPLGIHEHGVTDIGAIHSNHGLSIDSPALKSSHKFLSPIISSHHDYTGHIHGDHEIPNLHESAIGHDLTHSQHSGIEHDLTHSYHSDIGHQLSHTSDIENHHHPVTIPHSIHKDHLPIHGSSHSVIDHDDSDDVVEDHSIDIDDGHYTPLHESHSVGDHDSYLDGEVIGHSDKIHGHLTSSQHKIDDISVDKEANHKDFGKEYANQEHSYENNGDIKEEKYNKKPLHLPRAHKENVKISSHSYVEQKKTDHSRIHSQKDTYNRYQEDKHKSREHHIKGYEKPHAKLPIHRPSHSAESYPKFPRPPKHDSYDRIKYAGGRHPVRPIADNLEQTYHNSEYHSKNDGMVADRHPSYDDVQHKIEQQEQLHDDDYKPSKETSYKSDSYRKPHSHVQRPGNYKSGSAQPRGRTKIYRNYEKPRTSSYEIEILHSDSSDHKLEGLEDSDVNPEDISKEGEEETFISEENEDESDGFDSEESRQSLSEQVEEAYQDEILNSEIEE